MGVTSTFGTENVPAVGPNIIGPLARDEEANSPNPSVAAKAAAIKTLCVLTIQEHLRTSNFLPGNFRFYVQI